LFLIQLL